VVDMSIADAANARVDALELTGPARRSRLRSSARDLEALAPTLPSDLRSMATELAHTSDRALAADLRDELVEKAPAPPPPAEPDEAPTQAAQALPRRVGGFLFENVFRTALTALVGIGVAAGVVYLTRDEPVGDQVDEVRAELRGQGMEVEYRELSLGQGGPSHLFVAKSPPDRTGEVPPKADEVRIYDERGGSLEETLSYRPVIRFSGANQRPVGAAFVLRTVRDIDGDGQKEVLGSYETNAAGSEFQRLPVLVSRRSADADYEVSPLLGVAALPRDATAGLTLFRFTAPGGDNSRAAWVSDFILETGRLPLRRRSILAASVIVPGGAGNAPVAPLEVNVPEAFPRFVRFWEVDMEGGAPAVTPMCIRPEVEGSGSLDLTARFIRVEALLEESLRQVAESGALGELVDGNCVELST
jgi:hypothetical protein